MNKLNMSNLVTPVSPHHVILSKGENEQPILSEEASSLINRTEKSVLPVLKLIISERIRRVLNSDNGVKIEIRQLTLREKGEEVKYRQNGTLQKTYSKIKILLENSGEKISLDPILPEKYKNTILTLLQQGPPSPKYCCVDFFMDAMGYYSNSTVNHLLGKWKANILDESSLNTGDWIVINNENRKPVHYAMYLACNIYLSIGGGEGPFIITNLNEMRKGFDGVCAYKLTSKKDDGEDI